MYVHITHFTFEIKINQLHARLLSVTSKPTGLELHMSLWHSCSVRLCDCASWSCITLPGSPALLNMNPFESMSGFGPGLTARGGHMIREEAMVIEWSSDPHPADREIWDSSVHDEIQKLRDFVEGYRGGIYSTVRWSRCVTGKKRPLGNVRELMGYHFIDIVKSQLVSMKKD